MLAPEARDGCWRRGHRPSDRWPIRSLARPTTAAAGHKRLAWLMSLQKRSASHRTRDFRAHVRRQPALKISKALILRAFSDGAWFGLNGKCPRSAIGPGRVTVSALERAPLMRRAGALLWPWRRRPPGVGSSNGSGAVRWMGGSGSLTKAPLLRGATRAPVPPSAYQSAAIPARLPKRPLLLRAYQSATTPVAVVPPFSTRTARSGNRLPPGTPGSVTIPPSAISI